MMTRHHKLLCALALASFSGLAVAAGALEGPAEKQPLNITAIAMFIAFVIFTMGITKWAAKKTTSASDFYTAGGGITGF
ncbi:MAG: cation acetate symporter, partial [Rhodocyclaceae bacterium]|nr:cation acetate symporter [Rhodocyclaceae bacterium]